MHPLMFASGNIIASIIFGAIAMVVFGLSFPNQFASMLDLASGVKNWMTNLGIPPYYNNFVRLILHESTILFSFFTIGARVFVTLVAAVGRWLWSTPDDDPNRPQGTATCPRCGARIV